MNENEIRDKLFYEYSNCLSSIITGKKEEALWRKNYFPPLQFLIKRYVERKISNLLNSIEDIVLVGKELCLVRKNDSTTRIDLLGQSSDIGIVIIELKKSEQTERQAFTELLGYSNYFLTNFPLVSKSAITSVLIAPMAGRIVKDAYFQEILFNNSNVLALIPKNVEDDIELEVFYPTDLYYKKFANQFLKDEFFSTIVYSFENIDGWLDNKDDKDSSYNQHPNNYSTDALNSICSLIAQKMEEKGINGFVYSQQHWEEHNEYYMYPNQIIVCFINSFDNPNDEITKLLKGLSNANYWLDSAKNSAHHEVFKIIKETMETAFNNTDSLIIDGEYDHPYWGAFKESMLDSSCVNTHKAFTTGLVRNIFFEYLSYIYQNKFDPIFCSDDLEKYEYNFFNHVRMIWSVLAGLGNFYSK